MIKAAIFMGDPRYIYGLSYDVGTCTAHGVSASSVIGTFQCQFLCPGLSIYALFPHFGVLLQAYLRT
jgi:hypothetical protein